MIQPSAERRLDKQWKWRLPMIALCALIGTVIVYFPLLFMGKVSASDGQYPAFFEAFSFWSDLAAGGWPAYADINSMRFYPLRWLFPPSPAGFSMFTVSAPLLFAVGTALVVWNFSESKLASIFCALIAPGFGFIGAHFAHTSIIHAAAWMPFMYYFAVRLCEGDRCSILHITGLAMATAMTWLAGHPQISLYATVCACIAVLPVDRSGLALPLLRKSVLVVATVVSGIFLASIQIYPTFIFAQSTERAESTAAFVQSMSLAPEHLLLALFPFSRGGEWVDNIQMPLQGLSDWAEIVSPIGLVIILLACFALVKFFEDRQVRRCALLVIAGLSLSVLPYFDFAAQYLAEIPVFGGFRAWARWQVVSGFGFMLMASLSIAWLANQGKKLNRIQGIMLALLLSVVALITVYVLRLVSDHTNHALLQSIIAFVALIFVLIALVINKYKTVGLLVVTCLCALGVAEQTMNSRAMAWPHTASNGDPFPDTSDIKLVRKQLSDGGRFLAQQGWRSASLSPDRVRYARIPTLNWYGPLLDKRFVALSGLTSGGWVRPQGFNASDQALDIYGVRLLEVAGSQAEAEIAYELSAEGVRIGPGCGERNPSTWNIELPRMQEPTELVIYTSLACGTGLAQGTEVARLEVSSDNSHVLRAGVETAEWAIECNAGSMQHRTTVSTLPVATADPACAGRVSRHVVPAITVHDPSTIKVTYTAGTGGMVLHGMQLKSAQHSRFISGGVLAGLNPSRWRAVTTSASGLLYENKRWLPRFHFAEEIIALSDEQILSAIKTSQYENGKRFNAATQALVAKDSGLSLPVSAAKIVKVKTLDRDTFDIEVNIPVADALLVMADNYNDNWIAEADGRKLKLVRANYNQLGILVPAGTQKIHLYFFDSFLTYYVWLVLGLIGVSLLLMIGYSRRNKQRAGR